MVAHYEIQATQGRVPQWKQIPVRQSPAHVAATRGGNTRHIYYSVELARHPPSLPLTCNPSRNIFEHVLRSPIVPTMAAQLSEHAFLPLPSCKLLQFPVRVMCLRNRLRPYSRRHRQRGNFL